MHIEAELDPIHADRLKTLQTRLNKPLADVLAIAIDSALAQASQASDSEPSSLYQALESIGFVGCVESDEQLSTSYKQHLNFSHKTGSVG